MSDVTEDTTIVSLRDITDEDELREALSVLAGSDPEHCSYTKVKDRSADLQQPAGILHASNALVLHPYIPVVLNVDPKETSLCICNKMHDLSRTDRNDLTRFINNGFFQG